MSKTNNKSIKIGNSVVALIIYELETDPAVPDYQLLFAQAKHSVPR